MESIPLYVGIGGYPDFSFSEYPYYAKKFHGKAGSAPVYVSANGRHVTVTIEDDEIPSEYPIKDSFHIITTKVFDKLLWNRPKPEELTWQYCRLWDENGDETVSEVRMHSKKSLFGPRLFYSPMFGAPKRVTDYKVREARVDEAGLHLKFSKSSQREDRLCRWKQFPGLRLASLEDRQAFTLHKHNTIVFWDKLGERLSVRDAVRHGTHSMKKPDGISDHDFIYTPKPYQNQWWFIRRDGENQ
jgi:hypothetical protein